MGRRKKDLEEVKPEFEYTAEDFNSSTKPYAHLAGIKDSFEKTQVEKRMAKYAEEIGVKRKDFEAMNKAFQGKKKSEPHFGVTAFDKQKKGLSCKNWTADDYGITGETTVCPHALTITKRLVNVDTKAHKVELSFKESVTGDWQSVIVDKEIISNASRITKLQSNGIRITSETAKEVVRYLYELENENIATIDKASSISRMGYVDGYGFSPYKEDLIFDGDSAFRSLFESVHEQGDFEKWLAAVDMCYDFSTECRLIIDCSFASPLLNIVNGQNFFAHISVGGGGTGAGKTLSQKVAASVWGDPAEGKFLRSLDSTDVGRERTAATLNHLPYIADELQTVRESGKQVNVYKLSEGQGRSRGNTGNGVDRILTWKNVVITSGETDILSENARGGAVNRVFNIYKEDGYIIPPGKARDISEVIHENYGFAGEFFAGKIYEEGTPERIKRMFNEAVSECMKAGDIPDKQANMAAIVLVADRLVCEWIFKDREPLKAADVVKYSATNDMVSTGLKGYNYILNWVVENIGHFKDKTDGTKKTEEAPNEKPDEENEIVTEVRSQFCGIIDNKFIYIVKNQFDSAMTNQGFEPKSVLSWMKKNGKSECNNGYFWVKKINGYSTNCVCIRKEKIEEVAKIKDYPF